MAMHAGRGSINVTPLIDVLLVLLIIFMVIQPSTVQGLDSQLPQPPKQPEHTAPQPEAVVVEVLPGTHGAAYFINKESTAHDALQSRLAGIFMTRREKVMFVRGDAELDYAQVVDVIDTAHAAGVETVGIITPRTAQ